MKALDAYKGKVSRHTRAPVMRMMMKKDEEDKKEREKSEALRKKWDDTTSESGRWCERCRSSQRARGERGTREDPKEHNLSEGTEELMQLDTIEVVETEHKKDDKHDDIEITEDTISGNKNGNWVI